MLADARRFGLEGAALDGLRGRLRDAGPGGFPGVFRINAPVVEAFLAGASQWRTAMTAGRQGIGIVYVGLDYAGVRIALDALAIAIGPSLWAGLVIMEQAARAALNGEQA